MTAEIDEGHRGVKYQIPSEFKQFLIIYKTQLRLYTKGITLWIILALIVAIPILVACNATDLVQTQGVKNPNSIFAIYLALIPIITAVMVPMVIGELLPSEFRDRSAYLNFSIPQSKASFYFGKLCAGLTVLLGMYLLAYAMIVVCTMIKVGAVDVGLVALSLCIALCGALACAATVYVISQFLQKKTVIICMLVWYIALPGLMMIPYISNQDIADIFGYLPFFLPDYSLLAIEPLISTMSILGMFTMRPLEDPNYFISCIIGIVWAVVFLIVGYRLFLRRQL